MEVRIYSVLDVKADEFGPVFLNANDRLAERTVLESCRGGQSLLSQYPEDFILYRIGSFDTSTGLLKGEDRPVIVLAVKDITKREVRNAGQGS